MTVVDSKTNLKVSGAIVVLDNNAVQQTTNANGVAAFTGIAPGKHDVSVFKDGYSWVTAMQVNAANVSVPIDPLPARPAQNGIMLRMPVKGNPALTPAGSPNPNSVNYHLFALFTVNGKTYQAQGYPEQQQAAGGQGGQVPPQGGQGAQPVFVTDANGNVYYDFDFSLGNAYTAGQQLTGTLKLHELKQTVLPNTTMTTGAGTYYAEKSSLVNVLTVGNVTATVQANIYGNGGAGQAQPTPTTLMLATFAAPPTQTTLATVSSFSAPQAVTQAPAFNGQPNSTPVASIAMLPGNPPANAIPFGSWSAYGNAMGTPANWNADLSGAYSGVLQPANTATVTIVASAYGNGTDWTKWLNVNTGGAVSVTPAISAAPAVTATNGVAATGPTISWTPAQGPTGLVQTLDIHDTLCWPQGSVTSIGSNDPGGAACMQAFNTQNPQQDATVWAIVAPAGVSQVTLPAVPAAITRRLVAPGGTYSIQTGAFSVNGWTYEQALLGMKTNQPIPTPFENMNATTPVSWTR